MLLDRRRVDVAVEAVGFREGFFDPLAGRKPSLTSLVVGMAPFLWHTLYGDFPRSGHF